MRNEAFGVPGIKMTAPRHDAPLCPDLADVQAQELAGGPGWIAGALELFVYNS